MMMEPHSAPEIFNLPPKPGVYLFRDSREVVIYVGKAANLQQRVASYFQSPSGQDPKTLVLSAKISRIETIVTDTEKEALILENNLIKQYHPRYNVKLRDDKNYPYLRLPVREEIPTLSIVRRVKGDHALYFGPYPSMKSLRETIRWIQKIFPVRTSLDTPITPRLRKRSREEWGWKLLEEATDAAHYREAVKQVRMFLQGRGKDLIVRLRRKMGEEAGRLNFEAAAKIRDQIEKIAEVIEKQKVEFRGMTDRDALALRHAGDRTILYLLFVRGGKLLGGKGFSFPRSDLPEEETLGAFLRQYYGAGKLIPHQILIPREVPARTALEQWFSELRGKKMSILIPQRGEKKQLLNMAYRKGGQFFPSGEAQKEEELLTQQMKDSFHLTHPPRRIEAFDISNIQGRYAVGSMVFFQDGEPRKEGYRHFRIRSVEGANDYAMMKEVLLRRYRKARMEGNLPDLVLLDGGRGQLHVAEEIFAQLGIEGVDLLALAKENPEGDEGEKIYRPRSPEPILLSRYPALLNFLDRIRDEAHRFAIRYHAKLRARGAVRSILSGIPGIGPARQKILLEFFGSVERIKKATAEELTQAPGVSPSTARRIHDFFVSQRESSPRPPSPP